jgi:hypothetical protein
MNRSIPFSIHSLFAIPLKRISTQMSVLAIAMVCLYSCTTQPKVEKEPISKKPETSIQVASINVGNLKKRIGRNDIIELVKILKSEQIEILAVQGISRYPGVATRVDFVNELSAKTDWRNVFGEMLNISGRQTGNAIFSMYPILSHRNVSWDTVEPASFDAALQATIDAGARSLMIVSTQLPLTATAKEQAECSKLIAAMNPDTADHLTIVAGNMPADQTIRLSNSFAEVPPPESAKSTMSRIWFSANSSLQLLASRTRDIELGTLIIAQFGLSRQQNH